MIRFRILVIRALYLIVLATCKVSKSRSILLRDLANYWNTYK